MRKLKQMMLAACMLAGVKGVEAQNSRVCATMDVLNRQLTADPTLAVKMNKLELATQQWIQAQQLNGTTEAVITIPVVFHVIYANSTQNISDAKILEQLDVLNKDFGRLNADASSTPSAFQGVAVNTQIQFCLAQRDPSGNATSGIIRKSTSTSSFSDNDNVKFTSSGGDNAWDATKYLNIWVCNLGGGLLGYAQFPGSSASTDGVVALYSSVGGVSAPGTATPYHLGRTMTHEVGHWLNLRHIWGDANCGSDLVSDTPTQQTSNFGCPSYPHTTCSNGANGDMFMNYMDYTDDACMNMFTAGQASRMTASINTSRSGLLSSLGCTPPSTSSCGVPSGLASGSITTTGATVSWTAVSGAASYAIQYRVNGSSTWTSTTSTTNSKAITGLTAATVYQFQVQTVCSSTSSAFSSSATFTTSSTSTTCSSDVYESNNTSSTAKTIAVNTDIYALISTSTDKDWFKFTTTAAAPKVNVLLQNLPADYDVRLYNSSVSQLGISQNGSTTGESIKYNSSSAASTYYVQVYGYSGALSTTTCYKLRINTSASNFRTDLNADFASVKSTDGNLFAYPNPAKENISVAFESFAKQNASIHLFDILGNMILTTNQLADEGLNLIDLQVANIAAGSYILRVISGTDVYTTKIQLQK